MEELARAIQSQDLLPITLVEAAAGLTLEEEVLLIALEALLATIAPELEEDPQIQQQVTEETEQRIVEALEVELEVTEEEDLEVAGTEGAEWSSSAI